MTFASTLSTFKEEKMITEFRIIVEGKVDKLFAEWVELSVLMEGNTTLNPSDIAIPDMTDEKIQEMGKRHNVDFIRRAVYWSVGGKQTKTIEVERA